MLQHQKKVNMICFNDCSAIFEDEIILSNKTSNKTIYSSIII